MSGPTTAVVGMPSASEDRETTARSSARAIRITSSSSESSALQSNTNLASSYIRQWPGI